MKLMVDKYLEDQNKSGHAVTKEELAEFVRFYKKNRREL